MTPRSGGFNPNPVMTTNTVLQTTVIGFQFQARAPRLILSGGFAAVEDMLLCHFVSVSYKFYQLAITPRTVYFFVKLPSQAKPGS